MFIGIYNKCKKYVRNFIFRSKYSENYYNEYYSNIKIFSAIRINRNCTGTIYSTKHFEFIKEILGGRHIHTNHEYCCKETSYPLFTVSNDGRSIDVFISDKDTPLLVGDVIYLNIVNYIKK